MYIHTCTNSYCGVVCVWKLVFVLAVNKGLRAFGLRQRKRQGTRENCAIESFTEGGGARGLQLNTQGQWGKCYKFLVRKIEGKSPITRHMSTGENLQLGLNYGVQSIQLPEDKNELVLCCTQQWTCDSHGTVIFSNITISRCISRLLCVSFHAVRSAKNVKQKQ
jgi:hypothetical protein